MPVDLYLGGVEHAVLHLLYARFWHKVLFDIGAVSTKEPFTKLVNQGLILGPDGQKMSKSKGNVVNPDEMVEQFGADSLRLYEMFMGPLEDAKPWDPRGIIGLHRFLQRVHALEIGSAGKDIERLLHQTIKKVSEDIKEFRFNTAISAMMVLSNKMESLSPEFVKLLFPFAPHLAQELWSRMGNKTMLDNESWPEWDEKLIQEENFELLVQVNGKMRDKFLVARGITQAEAEKRALALPNVQKWVPGGLAKKVIFVKDRLINFII
jgi:leucyl-tRNA synthetase